jgi:hypothetical protein
MAVVGHEVEQADASTHVFSFCSQPINITSSYWVFTDNEQKEKKQ